MFSVILVFNTFFTYNCVKGQNLIKFTSRKGGCVNVQRHSCF
nr:MAG TPA: hypothetical protein [Caudoviricetes sp.]